MTFRQDRRRSDNQALSNGRPSVHTTSRMVKKKKNRNLKQIVVLSVDSLRERKVRSALTILMVVVGGALMIAINAISAGSAAFMNKQIGYFRYTADYELFYTEVMAKPKLKVSRFLETQLNDLGNS
jgi:hypothetical protein